MLCGSRSALCVKVDKALFVQRSGDFVQRLLIQKPDHNDAVAQAGAGQLGNAPGLQQLLALLKVHVQRQREPEQRGPAAAVA